MRPFNTGDCLIEVTLWTGLTVVKKNIKNIKNLIHIGLIFFLSSKLPVVAIKMNWPCYMLGKVNVQ